MGDGDQHKRERAADAPQETMYPARRTAEVASISHGDIHASIPVGMK